MTAVPTSLGSARELAQRHDRVADEPRASRSVTNRERGDGGLLLVFTVAVLVITAAVAVIAAAESLWILVPVMLVDFAVTAVVTLMVVRLLSDDG